MGFHPIWGLPVVTLGLYLGCATTEKQVNVAARSASVAGSSGNPHLFDEAIGDNRNSESFTSQLVATPNSSNVPATSGKITLASATTSTEQDIFVTASEPPRPSQANGESPPAGIANAPAAPAETPINLETALDLAAGHNPQVAFAKERIRESFARLESARVLWVPSLRAGVNYNKHEGRIQDVQGNIIETSRNSLYNGFGAQAVGAGSPAVPGVLMNFHMKDSIFQPRIAEQIVGANCNASQAARNDALLETAIAYIDLLEVCQLRAIVSETVANAEQLATLTQQFAKAGEGLQSDADRALAELSIRKFEVQRTIEQSKVQSVRLARLLSQDPQMLLSPAEQVLAPIELVDLNSDVASLVAQGLSTRPELTEHRYLVGEAIERLRREQYAPLVPSVLLGLSYGGNGGGLGSTFRNYGDRMDFDAAAFWEVRNLGLGEQSARCEAQSRIRQARYRQVQILDRVASEIVEAKTQVDSKQTQIDLAQAAITAARESYRRNSERIVAGQGLPIETQQSILALDQAQRLYATTVAEYNRAQFRLHRALGFPVVDASVK